MYKLEKNNEKLLVWGIIFVGFFLRVFQLTAKSLWFDEACSISFASNDFNIFTHRYLVKPVYFLILKFWVSMFGSHEFPTRFLSVIFGVLSVWLIYRLGKMLFSRKVGIISAFILASSSYHINYSQQVRNYSLFSFLGLASMIFFVKWLRKRKSTDFLCYLLTNIFLVYTHPYGVFIVLTQNLYLLVLFFINKKIFLNREHIVCFFWQLLIFVIFLSTFGILFKDNVAQNMADFNYMPIPSNNLLVETFETFAYGGTMQQHGGLGGVTNYERLIFPRVISVIFIPLFFLGGFFFKRKSTSVISGLSNKHITLLLLLWLGVTIALSYSFSKYFFHIYLVRYLLATVPAFYILVARGITLLRKRVFRFFALLCLITLSFFSLNILYGSKGKGDWKEVAAYIQKNIKAGDSVILLPLDQIAPFWYYYKYENAEPLRGIDRYGKNMHGKWVSDFTDGSNRFLGILLNEDKSLILKQLKKIANNKGDIWLIISPNWIGRQKVQFLEKNLNLFSKFKKKCYFSQERVELWQYSHF